MSEARYDFIVIGSGSSGAVVASRLSENPAWRVLLLEAGPRDSNPWIHIPIGYARTFLNPRYNWQYYTDHEPSLNGRKLYHPRGKTLGGSSSINGLVYIRGVPSDFDTWSQLGNRGWSYEEILPYFRRFERNARGDDALHGRDGPLAIGEVGWKNELTESFIKSAIASGLPANDDFNGAAQEGVGYFQLTQANGRRNSTARAYLRPSRNRTNLHIITEALVGKIDIVDGRAVGVTYSHGGQTVKAVAEREVILSGGTVASPQLLQLSGVGSAALLRRFGIAVQQDLPGGGENLQDHYYARLVYRLNRPISLNDQVNSFARRMMMGATYALRRLGPLTVGAGSVGVFIRSDPRMADPDIQIHMMTFSSDDFAVGLDKHSAFTMIVNQHRPESRGYVRIRSADPKEHPSMVGNYLQAQVDRDTIVEALKQGRRIVRSEPIRSMVIEETRPGAATATDEQLLEYAKTTGESVYHLVGTCRMGPESDRLAVVDNQLRVRGVRGLRIADASIMPRITSGNTNATCIAIGEKAAEMIAEDARAARVA